MRPQDRYLMFVRWSEEDRLYIGYCPDLYPFGGVCHGTTQAEAFGKLCEIVDDTVATAAEKSIALPPPATRPMREVETVS
ncbi:MAG: pilus assembly protein HicB [Verrucomicrobia bacterium]|nr:MAG: pilus assembly protein HicB [Verrucomicrobiota bacterium]